MGIKEIDNDLIDFAVEKYFEAESLIWVEKEGDEFIIKTTQLPVVN